MLSEIFFRDSTNGRTGIAIVGPEGSKFPIKGHIRHVGRVGGINTFEVTPDDTADTWIITTGECKVHAGATLVTEEYLQSDKFASILLLGPKAVIEHYSYKRRSSSIAAYLEGVLVHLPATILAALGFIDVEGEPMEISRPPVIPKTVDDLIVDILNYKHHTQGL